MKPGKKQKIFFAVAVLALLSLPLYFILRSENMLSDKTSIYRFRPERLKDPHDFLRGNYLVINFPSNVRLDSTENFGPGDRELYVMVERDSLGYAHFVRGVKNKPSTSNYFMAKASFGSHADRTAWIDVPFDKYFINEDNALLAERVYWREIRDTATNLYVEVSIRDGEALLKDIYLDSIPLSEYMNKLTPAQRSELENTHQGSSLFNFK